MSKPLEGWHTSWKGFWPLSLKLNIIKKWTCQIHTLGIKWICSKFGIFLSDSISEGRVSLSIKHFDCWISLNQSCFVSNIFRIKSYQMCTKLGIFMARSISNGGSLKLLRFLISWLKKHFLLMVLTFEWSNIRMYHLHINTWTLH